VGQTRGPHVDQYREDRQVGSMSVRHTEYVEERGGDDLIIRKFRSSELMASAPQLLQEVKERFEQDSRACRAVSAQARLYRTT
jgi:hypothetical protein